VTAAAFHCRQAWLGGETLERDVLLRAVDGVLTEISPSTVPPPGCRRLPGVVLPGFANAHSHAFHRALRGRDRAGAATFWSWRTSMYRLAERLDPDVLHELAVGTFAELLEAGFTAVGEFHYLHHDRDGSRYAEPNVLGRALCEAAATTGVRLTLLDTCYLAAGPDAPPEGVQRRFADASADAWAERVEGFGPLPARCSLGAAVHSVRAVPPAAIPVVAGWAAARDAPLHAHVSEQPAENEASLGAFGATPTAVLAAGGAVSPRFTAIHATHLAPPDRELLAAAGSSVCVCPTTERDLADGLVVLDQLVAAGVPLAIGTDAHVSVDAFDELRCLEGHERLRTGRRGTLSPAALLEVATAGGRRALAEGAAGWLEVGAPCDLVAVATDSVARAGSPDDAAALVAASSARDVRVVVVAGEVVVDDGRHVRVDTRAALARATAAAWS
jgi:formiminoglutamate deiminase